MENGRVRKEQEAKEIEEVKEAKETDGTRKRITQRR